MGRVGVQVSAEGVRLDSARDTVVLAFRDGGAPAFAYWGPRLPGAIDIAGVAAFAMTPIPQGMLDEGEPFSALPEAGRGFSGRPALAGHRGGRELITQFERAGCTVEASGAAIDLEDRAAGVRVRLTFELDSSGVLGVRSRVVNTLPSPLTVDRLASGTVPVPDGEVQSFTGRWAGEFATGRQRLRSGSIVHENRTGRTSHHAPPFLIAGEPGFAESHGAVIGLHLAWSGNHATVVERLRDGRIQAQAGELLGSGEIILAEGEAYETPWLYMTRSDDGLNGLSKRFHRFVRTRILGSRLASKPRPVHYNTWEAVYFRHETEALLKLADMAASVGAERFVLDDGWFAGRNDDRTSLGDWTVDAIKYPLGLAPLIAHVRGLGMEFGLWIEPEMANAESELLRAHPDWILGEPGRSQPIGRHQFVLDLTRPEVAEAVFAAIDALLVGHDIAYLKWDMNRDLTHAVSGGRSAVHRQTRAVYALIDRLRDRHPGVEIESCASGGARADFEILKRTERIWTSDCNDPFERQRIQRAFSIFFPPEVMGAHVGPRSSHTTARSSSLTFRMLTALSGHMGIEADLRRFSAEELAELAQGIALYKSMRGVLHGGRTIRLEHPDRGCIAQALGGPDTWLVTAAQIETPPTVLPAPLRLPSMDPGAEYTVRRIAGPRDTRASMKRSTPLNEGAPLSAAGVLLSHAGLQLPVLRAGEIVAYRIDRVPERAQP